MKIGITKEWCLKMAQLETGAEIGVGLLAFDPLFECEDMRSSTAKEDSSIAFGRFVKLMRRGCGLTVEKLADDADIDIFELVEIEDDPHHKPQPRAVYQLANYFKVPRRNLSQVAGLTVPRDTQLYAEAVRFAARSESVAALSPEERAALDAFVAVLNEQK
jgi:HTH-type transcriptional regulator, competence development regulator